MSRVAGPIASVALAACVQFAWAPSVLAGAHDALIAKHAAENGVPEPLVRRVIQIESRGRAGAVHKGNYGLMQIRLGTARAMGYSGDAEGLLDPDTNLTYAVKYLAGAYRAAGCDADRAVAYYQRGYYGVKRRNCGGPSGTRNRASRHRHKQSEGRFGQAQAGCRERASRRCDQAAAGADRIDFQVEARNGAKAATGEVRAGPDFGGVRRAHPAGADSQPEAGGADGKARTRGDNGRGVAGDGHHGRRAPAARSAGAKAGRTARAPRRA